MSLACVVGLRSGQTLLSEAFRVSSASVNTNLNAWSQRAGKANTKKSASTGPKKAVSINTKKSQGGVADSKERKEAQSQRKKDELLIRCLRGVGTEYKEYRTPEQLAECQVIAKEYSRQMMRLHKAQMHDLSLKIKLKDAAIAHMPADLLAQADKDDEADVYTLPVYPGLPTWSPPTKPTFGHVLE